ncbi:hypothetical protein [Paenibacillus tepidiphilus]|uniref:hypothetical protein n=1 Tax=Paenibacillus tepidiphilus TaxID=2608683 RepID=UPI001238DAC4|nr:hypothetical protein [Paenibacillus tepidiphilus]
MLIALAIFCAAAGTALLVAAAVLQFRLVAPPAPLHTLARSLAPFNLSFPERFITPDQSHIIALDDNGKSLAVGSYLPGTEAPPVARLYSFEAILGSELVENSLTLSKVSKTSRITSTPAHSHPQTHPARPAKQCPISPRKLTS